MAGKTTSAGYRLPMATSSYHEKCIAASVKAIKDVSDKTSDKTYSHGAYRDCNVVAQERIWSEYVQREFKQAKTWYIDCFFFITKFRIVSTVHGFNVGRKTGHFSLKSTTK